MRKEIFVQHQLRRYKHEEEKKKESTYYMAEGCKAICKVTARENHRALENTKHSQAHILGVPIRLNEKEGVTLQQISNYHSPTQPMTTYYLITHG